MFEYKLNNTTSTDESNLKIVYKHPYNRHGTNRGWRIIVDKSPFYINQSEDLSQDWEGIYGGIELKYFYKIDQVKNLLRGTKDQILERINNIETYGFITNKQLELIKKIKINVLLFDGGMYEIDGWLDNIDWKQLLIDQHSDVFKKKDEFKIGPDDYNKELKKEIVKITREKGNFNKNDLKKIFIKRIINKLETPELILAWN